MIVKITGNFSEEDLKNLALTLRNIESNHPQDFYSIFIDNPSMTMQECGELVRRIFPNKEAKS